MKPMLSLVLGLAAVSVALGDDEPIKKNPKPKDFLGKWVGKWDGAWKVQFTITQDPKSEQLSVLYEWEENVGKALQQHRSAAKIKKDALIMGIIEITLSAKETNKAKAVGKFKKLRTAVLTRKKE